MFVHEWAHLRWGVFDEYNNEKPFYINGKNKIKATRLVTLKFMTDFCITLKLTIDEVEEIVQWIKCLP